MRCNLTQLGTAGAMMLLIVSALSVRPVTAATLTYTAFGSTVPNPPEPWSTDPNLGGPGGVGPDDLTQLTDFPIGGDTFSAATGQTFATGTNTDGYLLSSFTIRDADNTGGNRVFGPGTLEVGTIVGTTFTAIASEAFAQLSPPGFDFGYFEYTFATPVALAANTQYAVMVTGSNQARHAVSTQNPVAGAWFRADNDGTNVAFPNGGNTDLWYHIELDAVAVTPAPEPSAFLLLAFGFVGLFAGRRRGQR